MAKIPVPVNFDLIEYNFTSKFPFTSTTKSIDNLVKCLTISLSYYYKFIKDNLNEDSYVTIDVKDHSYSIFLRTLLKKLMEFVKDTRSTKSSTLNSKSNSKDKDKNKEKIIVKEKDIKENKDLRSNINSNNYNSTIVNENELIDILNILAGHEEFFLQYSQILNYFSLDVRIYRYMLYTKII